MSEQFFGIESLEGSVSVPSTERLRKFANILLAKANDQKTLRVKRTNNLEPVYEWYNENVYTSEDGQERYEKTAGRLVRRVSGRMVDVETQHEDVAEYLDEWSLRVREMEQTRDPDGQWQGDVRVLAFDWGDDVDRSDYEFKAIPSRNEEDVRAEVLYGSMENDQDIITTPVMAYPVDRTQLDSYIGDVRRRRTNGSKKSV